MDKIIYNLNKKIYANNDILSEVINNLNQLKYYTQENLIIEILSDVINHIKLIINENKNINKTILSLNKKSDNGYKQTLKFDNGEYFGQVVNGFAKGKGIWIGFHGDKYEGEFNDNKKEGKGIYYYNNGNVYEGEWKNDEREGKGICYFNNGCVYKGDWRYNLREGKGTLFFTDGDRYEGDWKYDNMQGKAIFYFNNGDISLGCFYVANNPIGKHAILKRNGNIIIKNY